MPAARSEMKITGTEHRMLRALNTYRLLTYDTMRRVGVGRDQKTLSSATRHLQSRGLIGSREAVLIPGRKPRSLPTLFWLRPRGASALADFDPEAANALGVERDMRDTHEVLHRLGIVEIHIALREWADRYNIEVEFVGDFDPGQNGLKKATTVRLPEFDYVPDAFAYLTLPGDTLRSPLIIELERGGERSDLTTFFKDSESRGKLSRLRTLSAKRYIEHALARPDPILRPRFLVVFKDDALRVSALDRWRSKHDPEHRDWQWFFIKSLPEVAADFGGSWHQVGGQVRPLFRSLSN